MNFCRLDKEHVGLPRVPCIGEHVDIGLAEHRPRVQHVRWSLATNAAHIELEPVNISPEENLEGWLEELRMLGWSQIDL